MYLPSSSLYMCVFHLSLPISLCFSYSGSLYVFIRMDRHTNNLAISSVCMHCASKCAHVRGARAHARAPYKIHIWSNVLPIPNWTWNEIYRVRFKKYTMSKLYCWVCLKIWVNRSNVCAAQSVRERVKERAGENFHVQLVELHFRVGFAENDTHLLLHMSCAHTNTRAHTSYYSFVEMVSLHWQQHDVPLVVASFEQCR